MWLRARLTGAGMRPISNVVDVTNYVMLTFGSPLHAFDRALLAEGRIVVRRARERERIRTLDGTERELDPADLVIADAERPVAVAGIMGGEDSEVGPETSELLLEAANFDPLTVLRTSRRLRLRTESSDPLGEGRRPARGGAGGDVRDAAVRRARGRLVDRRRPTSRTGCPLDLSSACGPSSSSASSGIDVSLEEQHGRLRSLGFEVDGEEVTVPTWRARDVTRPVDLVEEVARFRLAEVPPTLPSREAIAAQLTREQRLRRQVEDVFAGAGFHEAYTWTLVPPGEGRIELQEPLSAEMAALRTDLELGLVESAERNRNAGVERVALFEVARVFLPTDGQLPDEPWHVAAITDDGFFGAKGAAETLYRALHVDPAFEPGTGREARTPEGAVRELPGGWGYLELDLDALFERVVDLPVYEDVITYPALKQDLAFVVEEHVRAGELVAEAQARRGRRAARDAARSTSTAATRSGRARSRSRSRSASSRPSGR